MYYPFLRGRQNELLAIRELINDGLINGKVIPVIEPVSDTSTYTITLKEIERKEYPVHVVINPSVGNLTSEEIQQKISFENINPGYAVNMADKLFSEAVKYLSNTSKIIAFYKERNHLKNLNILNKKSLRVDINFISNSRFRRDIDQHNLGCLNNSFVKQKKNADYLEVEESFFSDDHIFYKEEGYIAFSDHSIIGEEYSTSGFAPRAVAIHVVYFNSDEELMVKHFVSDSNDDISNPAGKFNEALIKLNQWYEENKDNKNFIVRNQSNALDELLILFKQEKYPGLGYLKKLTLKHHLEIMDRYLRNSED